MFIYPYRSGSKSVKNLKEALGIKAIRRENSKFTGGEDKIVINWGCRVLPDEVLKCQIINRPEAVTVASDKLKFFQTVCNDVTVPEFTTDKDIAESWYNEGSCVVARSVLNGNSGEGICIINPDTVSEFNYYDHSQFKMYVKYVPKKDEYRIHVSEGEVIDMQRKAKRADLPYNAVNWKVRNSSNGFVFVRQDVSPPQDVIDQSIKAVEKCGLDFGAVDVVWNEYRQKAYVIEVNTAPGLEGSTVNSYEKSFKKTKRPLRINQEVLESYQYFATPLNNEVTLSFDDPPSTDSDTGTPW